jgi:glycosyltransferase involved in cell wall biosynthesis
MNPINGHPPHLIWVTPNDLRTALDAATFLDTADELRKLGWNVTLIAGSPDSTQQIRGIAVESIPSPDIYFLGQHIFHQKALKFIKNQHPPADVVLFHQVSGLWMLKLRPWLRLHRRKRPLLVLDTRSVYMPEKSTRQHLKGLLRESYLNFINWAANRWTDGQTAITQRIAESIHIPPSKLWGCWPSGVNLDRFTPAAGMRQWPSPNGTLEMIYIGSTHYERNLLTLAKAVNQAVEKGMNYHLTIIGAGAQQEELKAFAEIYPATLSVHDAVPHEDIPLWLAKAHLGALPFPDEEKFRVSSPIKLFEYMAAGLPVMATRIACHTDVMHDQPYALYAEGADSASLLTALEKIWLTRDALPGLSQHAIQAAAHWSWTEAARHLKDALEKGLQDFTCE